MRLGRLSTRKLIGASRQCVTASSNMLDMDIHAWISATTSGASGRQIAAASGISNATIAYQLKSGVQPATVVAIARAYGASPLSGLVALGLITEEEAAAGNIEEALRKVTDVALADEILRRIAEGGVGEHPALDEPLTPIPFPSMSEGADTMLAARDDDDDAEAEAQQNEP